MIWKGITSNGSGVKDAVVYLNRMERKYGAIVKEAAGLAYSLIPHHCLAVVETEIDKKLCEKYGWTTIEEWRSL